MNAWFVKSFVIGIAFLMIATTLTVLMPSAVAAEYEDTTIDDGIVTGEFTSVSQPLPEMIAAEEMAAELDEDAFLVRPDGMTRIYVQTSDFAALDSFLIEHGLKPTERKPVLGISVAVIDIPINLLKELKQLPSTKAVFPFAKPTKIGYFDPDEALPKALRPGPKDVYTVEQHKAPAAWDMGFDGKGVNIAIIDSGIDFAHPDLQGRQARELNPASPYYGWPLVFDVQSVTIYEDYGTTEGTWYADTSTIVYTMGDFVNFDGYLYNVSEIPSLSYSPFGPRVYHIGYHPDPNLADFYGEPVAVLVAYNETTSKWDTVYVDLLNDKTFNNDKPCTRGDEISYGDYYDEATSEWNTSSWRSGDGFADISGGMIYWISDGINPLPLADVFYSSPSVPAEAQLVAFAGEFLPGESHGTGCAASAAGTGKSMDGMLAGMAPGASLICVPTYNSASIIDIWIATVLGYDGALSTGDEAHIASNSYGWDSTAIESGLDIVSAFNYFIAYQARDTIWCWATGNGGPGYGTANAVTHPLAVMVGAASSMGYRYLMGNGSDNVMYGDVIPFSDHGPTKTGKLDTDVIAAGAWGLTPAPLYLSLGEPNGNDSWMIFGGTSMACPVAAGALALIYQAFGETHGGYPPSYEAKNLLMCSADDVKHDVLKQGAGYINCERAVLLATDKDGISIEPVWHDSSMQWIPNNVWYPGGYRGTNYLCFPAVVFPGDVVTNKITVRNHNLAEPVDVNITDAIFEKSTSASFNYTTTDESPFMINITEYIPPDTDLTRITAYCFYDDYFDPGRTYSPTFNYGLELHNWEDIDHDGQVSMSELSRVTVDGSTSNMLQVTMHDPISRVIDGLILRMNVYFGGQAGIVWNFQIDNYKKQDWSWVDELFGSLSISAGGADSEQITLTVPADAKIGTYEGAVYLEANGKVTVCPILVHVAANDPEFEFGGNLMDEVIFDNNVTAAVDREWRAEVGDWRTFYVDVPDTYLIGTNKLYVTVNWSDVPTDIDVHMITRIDPPWLLNDEPYHMGYVGGSEEYYLGAGTYGFRTSTGGAQEVVGVVFNTGLNEIVLRNPIGAGKRPYELITGFTRVFDDAMTTWPFSVELSLRIPSVNPAGRVPILVTTSGLSGITDVPFAATTYGPVGGFSEIQWAYQDVWTFRYFEITSDYDYLKIMTDSTVPNLDIDLYVYWWDGSTWVFLDMSAGASAKETVMLYQPDQGWYLAGVYGYSVPGGSAWFDLTVEYPIGGAMPFTVTGVPATVDPGQTYEMNLTYDLPNIDGMYLGWVGFGFWGSRDNAARIPIRITLIDVAPPVIEPISPQDGEVIADSTPLFEAYINDTQAYSGIGDVSMVLDDVIWTEPTIENDIAMMSLPVVLDDGMHTLLIMAMDKAGNEAEPVLVTFYIDTTTSLDAWMNDTRGIIPNGGLTRDDQITVQGIAEVNSTVTVTVDGDVIIVPVNEVTGEFSCLVSLEQGSNSIAIVSVDEAGNEASMSFTVVCDSISPSVDILSPASGSNSTALTILVNVSVSDASDVSVMVNGVTANLVGSQWQAVITLREGWNTVTAIATDEAGNIGTDTITVEYIPPVYVSPDEMQEALDNLSDELSNEIEQGDQNLNDTISDSIANMNSTILMGLVGVLVVLLVAMAVVFYILNKKINALGGAKQTPVTRRLKETPPPPPPETKSE
jgi:subtilisin family serine protease